MSPLSRKKGLLIVFVGPSGSGKDTLLKALKKEYAAQDKTLFVERVITRPSSRETEDFKSVSVGEFHELEASGAFCLSWRAHDLYYGIPKMVHDHVEKGGIAFLNGARRALEQLVTVFPDSKIIQITVRTDVLEERLVKRGREDTEAIRKRLVNSAIEILAGLPVLTVDNSDDFEKALADLREIIKGLLKETIGK